MALVGFSFGKCTRDIVKGIVDIGDVMIIFARTYITDSSQIPDMVDSYLDRDDYLIGLDRDKCIEVMQDLYLSGRIHQGRKTNLLISTNSVWAHVVLEPTEYDSDMSKEIFKTMMELKMAQKLNDDNVREVVISNNYF